MGDAVAMTETRATAHRATERASDGPSLAMRDGIGDGLSVSDAAKRLGLSPDAVRSRLHRGTIAGAKVNGEWRVMLPSHEATPETAETPSRRPGRRPVVFLDGPSRQTVDEQERRAERPPDLNASVLLEWAHAQIAWLQTQLEARSQELAAERERADTLHRLALLQIEAITAGSAIQDGSDETATESVVTRQDGPSETIGESLNNESLNTPVNDTRRGFARWWDAMRDDRRKRASR
jgi:hypothetical protein